MGGRKRDTQRDRSRLVKIKDIKLKERWDKERERESHRERRRKRERGLQKLRSKGGQKFKRGREMEQYSLTHTLTRTLAHTLSRT